MQSTRKTLVILGTGGTIAGRADRPDDTVGYRSGEIAVAELLAALPEPPPAPVEAEQVAQLDSKDMDVATWQRLAQRAAHHLGRDDVAGVVVTHGTDTLEETAWLLQRVLAPARPVVLTGAMRPATAHAPDGPRNLADALCVAADPAASGVLAVLAGQVHAAADLRKVHTTNVDAFSSGDRGPLGRVEAGRVHWLRPPQADATGDRALGLSAIDAEPASWPWVAVLANHAGADGREVDALVAAGVRGLVVAGTGNGSLSGRLQAALLRAQAAGVAVCVASRCAGGDLLDPPEGPRPGAPPRAARRSPWQARVDLVLQRLAEDPRA